MTAASEKTPMEDLLGRQLLTKDGTMKPTKQLFKNKEIVALYFSASWCGPCKGFSPMLQEFYKHVGDSFEVIFVSSDRSVPEFKAYYETMPWLAIPTTTDAVAIKNGLAKKLQIQGIPTVVVLDVQTGHYITNQARVEVSDAFSKPDKAKALLQKWKDAEGEPLETAIMPQQGPKGIWKAFYFLLSNPMYIFGLLYMWKQAMRYFDEYMEGGDSDDNDASGGGEF